MSSQTQVRELFSLPKKEVIFDDFGCAYQKGILHQGRMYLTENYICFYSSIMGITQKVIIPLNDVTKVAKAKALGVLKALKIYKQGKKKPYKFQSFSDCDKTYSIIAKLWKNVSPNAPADDHATEEEDSIDVQNSSALLQSENIKKEKQSPIQDVQPLLSGNERTLSAGNNALNRSQLNNSAEVSHQRTISDNGLPEEELKNEFDLIMDNGAQLSPRNRGLSQKMNHKNSFSEQKKLNNDQQSNKTGIQFEKAQGIQEINATRDKESLNEVSKEDLEKLLEAYPIPENYHEMINICLNIPAKEAFQSIMIHSGPHSIREFYQDRGELNIQSQDWTVPEPQEEYDGKPVLLSSQLFADIQIKDNPFVKQSSTTKYLKLLERSDTKIWIRALNKNAGVPFSDSFAVEEDWLILQPLPNSNCCIVRMTLQIIFYKSTMFKMKIVSNTMKSAKEVWQEFMDWLKKRGLQLKEKKQQGVGKLKHGIEKSNKLFEKQKPEQILQQELQKGFKAKVFNTIHYGVDYIVEYRIEFILLLIVMLLFSLYSKMCQLELQMSLIQPTVAIPLKLD